MSLIVWKHHKNNIHNAFLGPPEVALVCATVYPYDGGHFWEIRYRKGDKISLIRTGSAKKVEAALRSVTLYFHHLTYISGLANDTR